MILGIDASRANHEQKTGVEWYAFYVIQELKKIVPADWQVVLYTDAVLQGPLAELPKNWTQKILTWPPRRLWTQIRLSTEMIQNPPDILWIPAHVPPVIHPAKTVMTVHDVAALHFPKTYNWFERWYSVASAKYAVQTLAGVFTISEAVKKDLVMFAPRKVGKIHVTPLAFNPVFSETLPLTEISKIKTKYNLPLQYVLSVGRLEEKKNTVRIVQAFDKAVQKGLDSNLVLVGKPGYGFEKVERAINQSVYKHKITVVPWVEEVDLVGIMQGAQMFVFPSLYEGFGLPVLQAFASRVPVMAAHSGSLPEVAGDAAVYVDPFSVEQLTQTMVELNHDTAKRTDLIERGLRQAQKFSWAKTARQTWDVLRNL